MVIVRLKKAALLASALCLFPAQTELRADDVRQAQRSLVSIQSSVSNLLSKLQEVELSNLRVSNAQWSRSQDVRTLIDAVSSANLPSIRLTGATYEEKLNSLLTLLREATITRRALYKILFLVGDRIFTDSDFQSGTIDFAENRKDFYKDVFRFLGIRGSPSDFDRVNLEKVFNHLKRYKSATLSKKHQYRAYRRYLYAHMFRYDLRDKTENAVSTVMDALEGPVKEEAISLLDKVPTSKRIYALMTFLALKEVENVQSVLINEARKVYKEDFIYGQVGYHPSVALALINYELRRYSPQQYIFIDSLLTPYLYYTDRDINLEDAVELERILYGSFRRFSGTPPERSRIRPPRDDFTLYMDLPALFSILAHSHATQTSFRELHNAYSEEAETHGSVFAELRRLADLSFDPSAPPILRKIAGMSTVEWVMTSGILRDVANIDALDKIATLRMEQLESILSNIKQELSLTEPQLRLIANTNRLLAAVLRGRSFASNVPLPQRIAYIERLLYLANNLNIAPQQNVSLEHRMLHDRVRLSCDRDERVVDGKLILSLETHGYLDGVRYSLEELREQVPDLKVIHHFMFVVEFRDKFYLLPASFAQTGYARLSELPVAEEEAGKLTFRKDGKVILVLEQVGDRLVTNGGVLPPEDYTVTTEDNTMTVRNIPGLRIVYVVEKVDDHE